MRTFGWAPTDEELKDLVNVIDQVSRSIAFIQIYLLTSWGGSCLFLVDVMSEHQDGNGDISFNEFVWLMTR